MLRPRPPTTPTTASMCSACSFCNSSPDRSASSTHLVGVHAADVERIDARGLAEDARAVRVEVGDEPGSSATSPPSG